MNYEQFRNSVKKVCQSRVHKINHCITTYEIYKKMRRDGWLNIGQPVSERDYYTIIRQVNNKLAEELLLGKDINLPYNLGKIELRKKPTKIDFIEGKLYTTYPIDWDATLKLWYEDLESYNNKILVRCENKEVFRVYYNKKNAKYNNKTFYKFRPVRNLKKQLSKLAKQGDVDAYLLLRYD